jgi:homoserine dehydrogenase
MNPIKVGLLGMGTVGSGTFNVLLRNQEEILRRAGRSIVVTCVADLDVDRAKTLVGENVRVVNDARAVMSDPQIDIVVELIGGYTLAKDLVLAAIEAGKWLQEQLGRPVPGMLVKAGDFPRPAPQAA